MFSYWPWGHHVHGYGYGYGNDYDISTPNDIRSQEKAQVHCTEKTQRQRSTEASKQMVFQVYGNCIAMLEEYERREVSRNNMKTLTSSKIDIPDQSFKSDQDVQTILQTQILLLETQIQSCLPEIRNDVIEVLKTQTIKWTACREIAELAFVETDMFVDRIYDAISEKPIAHPKEFDVLPENVPNVSAEDMQLLIQHQPQISEIDGTYGEGKKKASPPTIRPGDMKKGIERLTKHDKKRRKDLPDSLYDDENSQLNKKEKITTSSDCSTEESSSRISNYARKTKDFIANKCRFSNGHKSKAEKKKGY